MLHQDTPDHGSGTSDDAFDQALLALLTYDHQGLWSLAELHRSLVPSDEARLAEDPSRYATEDAVQRLYAAGMVHRLGDYVFATRAAHAVQRLAG